MKIERFEDIEAWQLARELTRKVDKKSIPEPLNSEPLNAYEYSRKETFEKCSILVKVKPPAPLPARRLPARRAKGGVLQGSRKG